jgi:hypothetical protein
LQAFPPHDWVLARNDPDELQVPLPSVDKNLIQWPFESGSPVEISVLLQILYSRKSRASFPGEVAFFDTEGSVAISDTHQGNLNW